LGGAVMNKKKGIGIAAFLLLLIIIAVTYFALPSVKTIKAISTEYINKVDFNGLYFAQEYVDYQGDIVKDKLLVKEGDRIQKGVKIYDNIYSSEAGILSTYLDNYENKFNKGNIFNTGISDIKKISEDTKPGIKIINNSEWYIYIAIDKDIKLKEYRSYEIVFNNQSYPGDIIQGEEKNDANYYLFRVKNDLDIINLHRNINGYIIKSRFNGIVVPYKALTSKDGKSGVLIKVNGYAEFRKAELLFEDKNKDIAVIIPETTGRKLYQYDDIISNPDGMLDGVKIR
jgi:hypothetical protein